MSVNLANVAREKGIRYFLISFTDLFGVVRSKLVPAGAIAGLNGDRTRTITRTRMDSSK